MMFSSPPSLPHSETLERMHISHRPPTGDAIVPYLQGTLADSMGPRHAKQA